jgi:hypothetical protein
MSDKPTLEQFQDRFSYNADSGLIVHKKSGGGAVAGMRAGWTGPCGYAFIRMNCKQYKAHRVAWLLHHGAWPVNQIDHINGIRDDNRIVNLREATNAENHQNRFGNKNNTSGHIGVSWNRQSNKWEAHIRVNGKRHHLGMFDCLETAAQVRARAKTQLHPFANKNGGKP